MKKFVFDEIIKLDPDEISFSRPDSGSGIFEDESSDDLIDDEESDFDEDDDE